MLLAESAHDVVDAFGEGLGSPIDGHGDSLLNDPDYSVAEPGTFSLTVHLGQFLEVNPRYCRVLDTRDDGLVEQVCVHFKLILTLENCGLNARIRADDAGVRLPAKHFRGAGAIR